MNENDVLRHKMHCIFRANGAAFGVPAIAVREIIPRPLISKVPDAPVPVAGLTHLRTEFLPVLTAAVLLDTNVASSSECGHLMVLIGPDGPWGLLIDRGLAMEPLEISLADDVHGDVQNSEIVIGTASFGDEVIRVINSDAIYCSVRELLLDHWHSNPPTRASVAASSRGNFVHSCSEVLQ